MFYVMHYIFFIQSHLINTLPFSYRPLIVHDMYISNSLLVFVKVLIILSIYRFQDFMITTRLDPVFGGLG